MHKSSHPKGREGPGYGATGSPEWEGERGRREMRQRDRDTCARKGEKDPRAYFQVAFFCSRFNPRVQSCRPRGGKGLGPEPLKDLQMAHNARSEHGCPVLLPRARRVLRPQPLKHVHASPSRGGGRRLVVPGARGVLGPQPPQNLEMSARCRLCGRLSAPRTPRLLRAQPLKHLRYEGERVCVCQRDL